MTLTPASQSPLGREQEMSPTRATLQVTQRDVVVSPPTFFILTFPTLTVLDLISIQWNITSSFLSFIFFSSVRPTAGVCCNNSRFLLPPSFYDFILKNIGTYIVCVCNDTSWSRTNNLEFISFKGFTDVDASIVFSIDNTPRTKSNGVKLRSNQVQLDCTKFCFANDMEREWNKPPTFRGAVRHNKLI